MSDLGQRMESQEVACGNVLHLAQARWLQAEAGGRTGKLTAWAALSTDAALRRAVVLGCSWNLTRTPRVQRPAQGISMEDTSPSPPGPQHPSPRLTQPVSTRRTPVVFTFPSQEQGWQRGDLGSNPGSAADMC